METLTMFAQAVQAAGCCAVKCPPHAIAAVAGAFVVGLLIGRLTVRKGSVNAAKSGQKPQKVVPRPRREMRPAETRAPIPAGSVEIYVGNLSYDLTEAQMRAEFEKYGKVDTARIVTNRYNDRSKGFGFVVMPVRAEAEAAIAALSEKEVLGRRMRVNEAKNTVIRED